MEGHHVILTLHPQLLAQAEVSITISSWSTGQQAPTGTTTSLATNLEGLSQDLETGCPRLATIKYVGYLFFKEGANINTQIITINMYLLIKIRHDILKQYHKNYTEVKQKSIFMLEINVLRNY